ncbi:MAG TPA: hypothetical protein VGL57_01980 [Solirubrobacteraceae bacterium]|jgi:hypothetical protein
MAITVPPGATRQGSLLGAPTTSALGSLTPSLEGSGERGGFSPSDLRSAYQIPASGGASQVVAIVDAYDDPNAEADLKTYRSHYGLSECTKANHCFTKINQSDQEEGWYPKPDVTWAEEISLDLDMVSAVCQECHIMLVEATNNEASNLQAAENEAANLGATEISNSWDGEERSTETTEDTAFVHPGIPITFASGDDGYWVGYPSASKYVIAVGGTALSKAEGFRGWQETAWEGAGSGCSAYESKPTWQSDPDCTKRTVADVAAVASPSTPVSAYDTYKQEGWGIFGGTSVAAPLIAGIEAHANKEVREEGAEAFYRYALFDVTKGTNAYLCSGYLCNAEEGYDGPTGWGAPFGPLNATWSLHATSGQATHISANGATLNGYVNPSGAEPSYEFEYGKTTAYGTKTPAHALGAGTTAKAATQSISGLERETTYHYRLVATSGSKTSDGQDHTFATSAWGVQSVPTTEGMLCSASPTCTNLNEVSCPSAGFCMAVGHLSENTEAGRGSEKPAPLAERWNGTEWQLQTLPIPTGGGEINVSYVSCSSSTFCIVTGYYLQESSKTWKPLTELWNGTKWQAEAGPATGLGLVSCVSSTFCMSVPTLYSTESNSSITWNGSTWSTHTLAAPLHGAGLNLESVSCSSATYCVAVGYGYNSSEEKYEVEVERWNGTTWSVQSAPNPSGATRDEFAGVSCSSATVCVAVGTYQNGTIAKESGFDGEYPFAERWNGSEWKVESTPDPIGAAQAGLADVSCSSSTSCTAGGESLSEGAESEPIFAERWNGSVWMLQPMAVPDGSRDELHSISCATPQECFAVGRAGGGALVEREALPEAVTEAASVTSTEATLKGYVNPEESDTHYRFEYGTSTAYGTSVPVPEADAGSGTVNVKVSKAIALKAGVYHFRLVASNVSGTSHGVDMSFTIV